MKRLIFAIMIFFTLLLTACSASSTSMPVSPASAILSMDTQLAFGTLKPECVNDLRHEISEFRLDRKIIFQFYEHACAG
jgi:uncharacterized lipoprotein YajG